MEKIKLGIIGCGIAANKLHYPTLQELKNKFEIAAVSNHTEKKAKEFSTLTGGVPYYLDYKNLLDRKDIEAVDIALPIHLNYQAVKDALDAGKHVFVEKPLAANLEEAEKMLEFSGKYQTVMLLAENFRYKKLYLRIKEIIEESKIGRPYSVVWNNFDNVNDNEYGRIKWRKNHQYKGGFITDGGVHSIAALRLIFGEITPVSILVQSANPEVGKIDTCNLQMKFSNGISGSLFLYFSTPYYYENRILIFGEKGTLISDGGDIITLKTNFNKDYFEEVKNGNGFIEEFEDFYSAVKKGTKVRSTFEEGYKDLKTILDALSIPD
jgi:predicted dehydrogenase